jgi:hypothetical protein
MEEKKTNDFMSLDVDGDIKEQITKKTLMNVDALKAAAEQITKKEQEIKIEQASMILSENKFERCRQLILLRYKRGEETVFKIRLKSLTELGETFKTGTLSVRDYYNKSEEIKKVYSNGLNHLNTETALLISQLQELFASKDVATYFSSWKSKTENEVLPEDAQQLHDVTDKSVASNTESVANNASYHVGKNR